MRGAASSPRGAKGRLKSWSDASSQLDLAWRSRQRVNMPQAYRLKAPPRRWQRAGSSPQGVGSPLRGARASEIGVKGDTGAHAGAAEGNDRVLVIGREQDHHAGLGVDGDLGGLVLHAIHVRAGTWIDEHDRPFLGRGAFRRRRDADIVNA